MKITWNWLAEYVDLSGLTPEQTASDLTNAGIPVEWMERLGPSLPGVVVGRVLSVAAHPDADRLRVCTVDVGAASPLAIVCGAANVAAGQKVPVACDGAVLPGGAITRSKLRGVVSEGMVCSAAEIGLNTKLLPKEQTSGILVLQDDARVGEPVAAYLGFDDVVLELELTPNRGDCLSLRGVAYEVAALYGRAVRMPDDAQSPRLRAGEFPLSVRIDTDLCQGYAAQVVAGVVPGPAPIWMQMRLLAVGVRPTGNIVDITNYVMYEWGQPLHAFDYDAIADGGIVVRQARDDEEVATLDGQTRRLWPDVTLIADGRKALGLAGVMGGRDSEVTGATRTVVIESARFDPLQTRKTGKALQLRSEAEQRFERGVDPAVVKPALARAVALLERHAAGRAGAPVFAGALPDADETAVEVVVSPAAIGGLLGYEVTAQELTMVCGRLGFAVRADGAPGGDRLRVSVPSRRADVAAQEDVAEEFARLAGYDRIPATLMEGELTAGGLTPRQHLQRSLRHFLLSRGLQEVWTYTLTSHAQLEKAAIVEGHPLRQAAALDNPLSEERAVLRTTMLPSLLEVAQYNANRRAPDIRIFELGAVFYPLRLPVEEQPGEARMLAGLLSGRADAGGWQGAARAFDFFDVSGMVEDILDCAGVSRRAVEAAPDTSPYFQPGQAAMFTIGGLQIALFGQVRTTVAERFDLHRAYYFEVDFDALDSLARTRLHVQRLPRHPASERDLALVVADAVTAQQLLSAVRKAAGPLLADVRVFDVFSGGATGDGRRSIGLRLVFQADDRTLTDDEINGSVAAALAGAARDVGAELRAQ